MGLIIHIFVVLVKNLLTALLIFFDQHWPEMREHLRLFAVANT